jgi:hypothetical protein
MPEVREAVAAEEESQHENGKKVLVTLLPAERP